jgi:hypothetical protein
MRKAAWHGLGFLSLLLVAGCEGEAPVADSTASAQVEPAVLPATIESTPSDTESFRAALEILELTNARANVITMLDAMLPTVIDQIRAAAPNTDATTLEQYRSFIREGFEGDLDEYVRLCAALYEKHFTEEELLAMAAFYRTPTGRKMIQETPELLKELVPIGMAWGENVAQRAVQRVRERLNQNGGQL